MQLNRHDIPFETLHFRSQSVQDEKKRRAAEETKRAMEEQKRKLEEEEEKRRSEEAKVV